MLLEASLAVSSSSERARLLTRAVRETDDSTRVLRGGGLHAEAVAHLHEARRFGGQGRPELFFVGGTRRRPSESRRKRERSSSSEGPEGGNMIVRKFVVALVGMSAFLLVARRRRPLKR